MCLPIQKSVEAIREPVARFRDVFQLRFESRHGNRSCADAGFRKLHVRFYRVVLVDHEHRAEPDDRVVARELGDAFQNVDEWDQFELHPRIGIFARNVTLSVAVNVNGAAWVTCPKSPSASS